jgi:hypothetical protein
MHIDTADALQLYRQLRRRELLAVEHTEKLCNAVNCLSPRQLADFDRVVEKIDQEMPSPTGNPWRHGLLQRNVQEFAGEVVRGGRTFINSEEPPFTERIRMMNPGGCVVVWTGKRWFYEGNTDGSMQTQEAWPPDEPGPWVEIPFM